MALALESVGQWVSRAIVARKSITILSEDSQMRKGEKTSPKVAKVAGKVLKTGKATVREVKMLAGSALTQAAERKQTVR